MILSRELGGYGKDVVRYFGSFRINGTSDPDTIRDGNSALVDSVSRASAGLFTVTLAQGPVYPENLITSHISIDRAAVPTQEGEIHMVVDSYDPVGRTFQVAFTGDTSTSSLTPKAYDPDDNDMVTWELVGSIGSVGQDPA